jgi:hypothetical protein
VQQLLTALGVAASPTYVVKRMKAVMDKCVSPLAHQYFLEWLKEAVAEFGCGAFPVPQVAAFCVAEMDNKNATVRTAAGTVDIMCYCFVVQCCGYCGSSCFGAILSIQYCSI